MDKFPDNLHRQILLIAQDIAVPGCILWAIHYICTDIDKRKKELTILIAIDYSNSARLEWSRVSALIPARIRRRVQNATAAKSIMAAMIDTAMPINVPALTCDLEDSSM
jgi:hypothetical protein